MLCFPVFPVTATDDTESPVESIVYELLRDALSKNTYFNIPEVDGKTIYLCHPINPHYLRNNVLIPNPEIEYYLIKANTEYIACVTVCYSGNTIVSASFSTNIASALEHYNIAENDCVLVANGGFLYIKTTSSVSKWNPSAQSQDVATATLSTTHDSLIEQIHSAQCELESIAVAQELDISTIRIGASRSWRYLDVPFVSQEGLPICWAAAASALGQFYTGRQYTASEISLFIHGGTSGGSMDDARTALRSLFNIETTRVYGEMRYNTIINHLHSSNPLLVGFSNAEEGHMVVLCGYDYSYPSTQVKYYFRDSNFTSLQTVMVPMDGPIQVDYFYDTGAMTWIEAAYKV